MGFIGYYGDDLSGRAGCSNNNWGVVHVTRRGIPDGKIFRKLLQTSKAEGQTIFEDGYTTFGKGDYSGAVDGVSVLPMYATASESVSVTDAQGGYRSAARPGDTLEYGLSSNVKNVKVYDGFKARFTACADPWLTGFRLPEYETDEWDMTALDKSKAVENGCAVGSTPLLFDHKGKATYTEMPLSLYWTAKVSNFANASRTISSPARIEASTPASHGLKADKAVSEWSSDPAPANPASERRAC